MAQVSSGTVSTTKYEGRYLKLNWSVDSTNIKENYKRIYWSLVGAGGTDGYWYYSGNFKAVINGTTVYKSSDRIKLYKGTVVASGYINIYHDNEGNKTFTASAEAGIYTVAVNCKGSGTFELPTIPRYATSVQSLSNKTETTIKMNWSSDNTIDYIWYSKDDGSNWTGIDVTDGTSGSYTISGLSANTTYKIKTRVRRKDSQLTTDSSALSVTTYNYPYCTNMPNVTIGNILTINFYNPLSRNLQWTVIGADGSTIASNYTTATSYTGLSGDATVNNFYASIPNAKSGTYKVKVTYGSSEITKTGGTYTINTSQCTPEVGSFTYKDNNSTTSNITGNNQRIIRNNSVLLFMLGAATAKKSATISKYEVTTNGVTKSRTSAGNLDFGKLNVGSNINATLKVTDSRGLTASKTISITIDNWSLPTAITTMKRKNNYYSDTYITVDGTYSSLNGKNSMTINIQYKKVTDSSYSTLQTLKDNVESTFTFDNTAEWNIRIIVKDLLGTTTYNLILARGMPLIYFDRLLSSVGVNKFPQYKDSISVTNAAVEEFVDDITINKTAPRATITNGTRRISLHIGEGGINRGIWDDELNQWIFHSDGEKTYANGLPIIPESVSTNSGIGIKFPDGTLICRGKYTTSSVTMNAWGVLYSYDFEPGITFPVAFTSTPMLNCNISSGNAAIIIRSECTTTKLTKISIARPDNNQAYTFGFDWVAIGRWK